MTYKPLYILYYLNIFYLMFILYVVEVLISNYILVL